MMIFHLHYLQRFICQQNHSDLIDATHQSFWIQVIKASYFTARQRDRAL